MRRIQAIFLLLLFSFALIGPALADDSDSSVPECCRRLGLHHCSSMGHSSGTALRAPRCANYPASLAPAGGPVAFLAAAAIVLGGVLASATIRSETKAFGLVSLSGSHSQRGPPASFSFA